MNLWRNRPLESRQDLRYRFFFRLYAFSTGTAIYYYLSRRYNHDIWYFVYLVVMLSTLGLLGDLYLLKHPETNIARGRFVWYTVAFVLMLSYRLLIPTG